MGEQSGGPNPKGSGPGNKIPKLSGSSRAAAFWVVLALLVLATTRLMNSQEPRVELAYTEFKTEVLRDNVQEVLIVDQEITGLLHRAFEREGRAASNQFETYAPANDDELIGQLETHNVIIRAREARVAWGHALLSWMPIVLILMVWLYLMRQMQSGGNKAFSFGKSKARLLTDNKPKVTFADVAGVEEAKTELAEVVEFLRDPAKFQKLGGKIPKGALLLGPPGTGKTLLARAIAGEADVPFFSMSGSDFVEMFVGVGASRVRDLFEQGKKSAPCIIFIDEIDAVGRHRGAGLGGGHDEREQTLNQLLVEMDGFESNEGVILVAATNRPDVLDPALLRPGRFDRQIVVDRPDVKGREGILKVHVRTIPLASDVELFTVARGTPGFTGADLANLVNESALLAARSNDDAVYMRHFEEARDKVMMGAERRSLLLSDEERRKTAYHEAGHTLARCLIPGTDPLHKVTIIPRGRALGVTWFIPERDRFSMSKTECENDIACMLGGRVAELIMFNEFTTGAGDDLNKATDRARKMVCEWGMSEKLGPLTFGQPDEEIFLGRDISQRRDYSEGTAALIDQEIRSIVEEQETRTRSLLTENFDKLRTLSESLLKRETLDAGEVKILLDGGDLPPLPDDRRRPVGPEDGPASPEPEAGPGRDESSPADKDSEGGEGLDLDARSDEVKVAGSVIEPGAGEEIQG